MAKINDTSTYPDTTPAMGDLLPATDISNTTNDANGETVNFSVQSLVNHTEINAQTGTTYTLVLGDRGKIVTMSNAATNTLSIPLNSSVAFAVGTCILVQWKGVGITSIAGVSGVTMEGGGVSDATTPTCAISNRYGFATIIKMATDTWAIQGDVGAIT